MINNYELESINDKIELELNKITFKYLRGDKMDIEKIHKSLTNQKPNEEQIERIENLRYSCMIMADEINDKCPDSREKSLAITKLEECLMWAVKSIVLEEKDNK